MSGNRDQKRIFYITLLVLTVFFAISAVSAAENVQGTNNITDGSILDNSIDEINSDSDIYNSNNNSEFSSNTPPISDPIISGNVTRCTNGSSFPGVTVVVNSLDGTEVARTTTDINGFYQVAFPSNERTFHVTASYPGHMTISKLVTVEKSTNPMDPIFYAWVNFQLGPEPNLAINAPSEQFLNTTFNFQLTFNNTGNETGFGPIVQLILPPEIQFNSATFLGAPVSVTNVGIFPISGTLIDPLSGLTVNGTPGDNLYILEYPLGSFTTGQPNAVIDINAFLLGNSTLGVPLNITGYPVFRFGANETGTVPIRGNGTTSQVTPTVISLTKTSNAPEDETATGHNYIRTYTLTVDVAPGRTVNDVIIRDDIPYNLEFIEITYPSGLNVTHYPTISEHWLTINLGNLTGLTNTPLTINYTVFANKTDINGNPVLNLTTGASTNATNMANVTGTYETIPVSAADDYTLTLRSLAIQKGVVDETNPGASRPLDILRYTLNFQVSDYFGMSNLIISDTLGDGQSFLNSSTYNPRINLHLPGQTITNLLVDLNNSNQFQYSYSNSTGITNLTFNISQILIDNGYLIDGTLYGGNFTGTDFGATQGSLTFWSIINIYYEDDTLVPTPHPIVSSDTINNLVRTDANPLNTNVVTDGSGSSVVIVAPTPSKTLLKIDGLDPVGPPYVIQAGQNVTFSLEVIVPTTNLHNFCITDFLPIPFFRATQFTNNQTQNTTLLIPSAGQWRLGANDTLTSLSGVTPEIWVDATQNTLRFVYCDIYNATQPTGVAHILFTITATGDPMADGLWLTNLMNVNYENSPGERFTDNKIVSILTGEPLLSINKTATPTSGLQAGDVVTYNITLSNSGRGTAYNVVVADDFLTANNGYISALSIAASYVNGTAITGLNLMDLFTTGGLNFTTLYPIYPVNGTNNTILITYNATLNGTVYPRQYLNNTVNITKFTSLTPPDSPNFVGSPAVDQSNFSDDESVQARDVNFTKSYISSLDGVSSTPNLTIGESGLFRLAVTLPAGQIQDLYIRDILPAGLSYVSHALDLTGYSGTLAPLTFSQVGNTLNFTFMGATNTTANSTFYINLTVRANNNTPYPGSTNVTAQNTATMDWNNPGHTPITRNASVNIIQPLLNVTKQFTPSTVQGGQLVQVRIRVTNTGSATAQHVIITDPLNGLGSIFDLSSLVSYDQNGFTFTYPNSTVTFSWGNINPGQTLDFYFNITTLTTPFIGPSYINIANATYWSLPWNGSSPDANSRNYTSTGNATLITGDPTVNKTIVNSSIHGATGNLTIGEIVTYRLTVTLPQGLKTNLQIIDTLPPGFSYVINSYYVNTTGFAGTLGTLVVPPSISGQNVTFLFNGITNMSFPYNNTFYIDFNATVLNQTVNQAGQTKTNTMSLTWAENTRGPFTSTVNANIVEPLLTVNKAVSPSTVDGGDVVTVTLTVNNIGTSPAYQVMLSDVLNTVLFNSTTVTEWITPSGFTFTPGSTVLYTANTGTFIDNGTTLTFRFNVTVNNDAPTNSTFQNWGSILYSSMPPGFNETRNYTNTSNVVNITTVSPSIGKFVDSTSEPDSTGTNPVNVFIGEVVTYRLDLIVPQGKTLNVVLQDILAAGRLSYIPNSAQIKRNNENITATGFTFTTVNTYENILDTTIPQLTFNLGNITFLGTNGLQNGNISLIFKAVVMNNNNNTRGSTISNTATFNCTNATGQIQSRTSSSPNLRVQIPELLVTKTANPTTAQGDQTINFNVRVTNNGGTNRAPLYDIQVLDPMIGYYNLNILSIMPSSALIVYNNYSNSTNLYINITQLNTSQYVDIIYTATLNTLVKYSNQTNNTVVFNGTSLPGLKGTGNATPGDPGTITGERTGNGVSPNNLRNSATAIVTALAPTITKSVVGSTQIPVGQEVPYRITITLPVGSTDRLIITDEIPAGMYYVPGSTVLTLKSGVTVDNNPPIITVFANRTVEFNLGALNCTSAGNITLDFLVVVQNVTSNVNGTGLTNNATVYYSNPLNPLQNITGNTSSSTITVIEPNVNITKTADPTLVDGGDDVQINFTINNTGSSPAYQIIIIDNLDPNLFDGSFSFTPVSGYTFTRNVNTVTITANSTTSLASGASQIFNIFLKVRSDVNTNSTFTNLAAIQYSSMPPGFNETRNYTNTSNVVTFRTVTPSISKSVNATSEPDSTNPNVFIGEVVTYQFNFTIPEGKTDNVSLIDTLLSNLGYNSGSALIKRSSANITATGFDFGSFVDQFISITPSTLSPLTFSLGNVTNIGGPGLTNGTITLLFNTTVLNIAGNQAGTQIPNNATLNFTNSTGDSRTITCICPTTLNVVVPQISTVKTANPTVLTSSDTVTFNIVVRNNNNVNGAPVYDVVVIDPMNGYNIDYLNMIITPSDPSIIFTNFSTGYLLNITINQLNQTQYLNITYNATVKPDVTFNSTLNNTVNATGTTVPGDHGTNNATPGNPGTSDGKRTGDPSQPAGAVNNIIATSTATVTTRSPRVSKNVDGTKTVTHTIGETATELIIINLPIGTTTELRIIDVLPAGLQASGFTYTTTTGVFVNQFVVTPLGGNTYEINFGNVTITQEGNLTINYTVLVLNIPGNQNGQNLTNNATLYYRNSTGQSLNAGSDTATVRIVEPNLQIVKTPSKTNLTIGEQFTYTLFITHTPSSTSDAYNLIITDTIPTGLTFVIGSQICPDWSFSQVGNLLTFTRPSLTLANFNSTILFNCTVDHNISLAGQNITNAVNLNYTSITSGGRNYTANNSTQIHVTGADLQVIKNGDSQVNAGEQVTYTITVNNLGPDTAENVTMNDIFSAPWFTYLSNPEYSLNFGTWTAITSSQWSLSLGNMTSGSSSNVRIRANVIASAPAGILNNTANVTSNTTDPNPNNNNSTSTTNVTQTAILTLLKENNPSNTVIAGNNLLYNLTLTNTGPSVARDVTLIDNTFSSYYLSRFYSYSVNGGAWSSWIGFSGPLIINVTNPSIFSAGYMGVGDVFRVMINGTVNASTPNGTVLLNNATANSTTSPFNVTSNTVTNNVETSADVGVAKSGPDTVTAGTGITYVVVVTNYGPSDSQNVVFTDVIPSWIYGVTYGAVSSSYAGHNVPSGTVWGSPLNWATLYANEVITLTFVGTVNASTPNGTVLNNSVNVSALTLDPDLTNNNATKLTTVDTSADVGVAKSGPDTVTAGNSISYVVVVTNYGPSDSQNVVFTDVIPSWIYGVTYGAVSSSHSEHDVAPGTLWVSPLNWVTLFANEVITLTFTGTVNASTPNGTVLNNTVNVTALTPDPDLTNNNATQLTTVNTIADLAVIKMGPTTVTAGNSISYVVVVTNYGPSDSQGVVLNDVLPIYILNASYTAVSNSHPEHNIIIPAPWNTPLTWTTLYANEVLSIILTGTVNASTPNGTVLNNSVNVSALTLDPNPNNNNDTQLTVVETLADVGVTKSGPDTVTAGNSINYVVIVTNYGPSDSQGVVLNDLIPAYVLDVTFGAVSSSHSEHDVAPGTLWVSPLNWVTLFANEVITLTFTGTVNASTPNGTVLNNTVNVSALTPDPDLTNNNATKLTTVDTSADVGVTKVCTTDPVVAGNSISYVVVVTNYGPSDAQNVVVSDVLPVWILPGATYTAVSNSHSVNDRSGIWSSPQVWTTLYANEFLTLTFSGVVNASTPNGTVLNNTVNVSALTLDPNLLNNNATNLTTVTTLASLNITKTSVTEGSDVNNIVRGYLIHYTIVITNEGPSDALNVTFDDNYTPDILVNTYYSTSTGIPWTAYSNPLNLNPIITRLAPGQNVTIWINGTVMTNATEGINNTAGTSSPTDPDGRKTAWVYNNIQTSHVTIEKTVSNPQPYLHEIIYFTLIVQNWGPDTAIDVYVDDKLPAGIVYISSTANYGSYNPDTGIWTIGNLPANTIAELIMTVGVEKLGPIENHAHVYTASWDPILGPRSATASIYVREQPQPGDNTIGMQSTGTPANIILLALFLLLTGLTVTLRRR